MPRQLTPEDRADLTDAEIAAIEGAPPEADDKPAGTEAAPAAKTDDEPPAGTEGTPPGTEETTAAAPGAEPGSEDETDDEPLTQEQLAAVLEGESAPAPAAPAPYKVPEVDFKAKALELSTKKGAALKQLMDGEIDAEQFAAIDAEVTAAQSELTRDQTLAEANRQQAERVQQAAFDDLQGQIKALMVSSKGTTIDYNTDVKAQQQFDNALRLLATDEDNASLTPAQIVAEANRMVRALRGVAETAAPTPPPPAPSPAPTPKPRDVPTTLSGVPVAAPNGVSADIQSKFALLQGEEAEEFLERLPKAQREALLSGGALV